MQFVNEFVRRAEQIRVRNDMQNYSHEIDRSDACCNQHRNKYMAEKYFRTCKNGRRPIRTESFSVPPLHLPDWMVHNFARPHSLLSSTNSIATFCTRSIFILFLRQFFNWGWDVWLCACARVRVCVETKFCVNFNLKESRINSVCRQNSTLSCELMCDNTECVFCPV